LGLGHTTNANTFTKIPSLQNIRAISAGHNISMFIDTEGRLYSAGSALLHGNKTEKNQVIPVAIEVFEDKQIKTVSCGAAHCAAVDSVGILYTWGSNSFFQLGHGNDVLILFSPLEIT